MSKNNLWWNRAVIYELYADKFAGNFKSLSAKLDYFKKLGVNSLLILPHYPSPMIDGGYDISDFKKIRRGLGSLKDFQSFVKKAHCFGLKIITDLILNHTSSKHSWFQEARSSKDNPKRDFYLWSKTGKEFALANNPFTNIKPSNWIYNHPTKDYYYATFYPQQPDLNWDNPEVFKEMKKIIDFWLDIGVDGFRLDAVTRLFKREGTDCINSPEVHPLLKKIRAHIDKKYSKRVLLAETDLKPPEAKRYFGHGDECHLVFHFFLAMKIWLSIKRNEPKITNKVIEETLDIPENCQWATFLGNHDAMALYLLNEDEKTELANWLDPQCEFSSKLGSKLSMRLAEIFKGNKEKILASLKLLFSLPGVPVIYYGDEVGMRNAKLKKKPQDPRFYVRGKFNWKRAKEQIKHPGSIFNNLVKIIDSHKLALNLHSGSD